MGEPHRKKSKRQNWRTPQWLFEVVAGNATLDAAASENNALCPVFYTGNTPETDGLLQPWHDLTWCNPPFDQTGAFVDKAIAEAWEGRCTWMLITSATENLAWYTAVTSGCLEAVMFITGRISFLDPVTEKPIPGNVIGSALLLFGPTDLPTPRVAWVKRDDLKKKFDEHNTPG